jgi:type IV pilus assembly protein PilW
MKIDPSATARRHRRTMGFTLVELMVAMALGMLLTVAMGYVYMTSRTAFSRQQQLTSIQQSVRTAFEFLSNDARMVGHMGCYTGLPLTTPAFNNNGLSSTAIATNFAVGVEGYEYRNTTTDALTLSSSAPADETDTSKWETNVSGTGINTIPIAAIAGAGNGLTPGSDVLVIRTVASRPVRLAATANTGANQSTLSIESGAGGSALCADGSTAKTSGFCPGNGTQLGSYGLIASCSRARVFQVSTITAGTAPSPSTLTLAATMGADPQYAPEATEVFPMQTIVYYVRKSSSGTTTSLYRRIFDGDHAGGLEQELIEGVESLQVRYGIDTTTPDADGVVDKYVAAKGTTGTATDSVTDWSRVVAVRMGLLIRSTTPLASDFGALPATGVVNGVTVTYPTSGAKFDRRVFTTTLAVRNKITYF